VIENNEKETAEIKEEKEVKKIKKTCKMKDCKRPYRAKGYCTTHYQEWRKGSLPKAHYLTCHHGVKKLKRGEKKECLKRVFQAGLCEEHYKATRKNKPEGATAA